MCLSSTSTNVVLFLLVTSCAAAEPALPLRDAYKALAKNPADKSALEALTSQLPRVGDRYVVQGDLLLTREQIGATFITRKPKLTKPRGPMTLPELEAVKQEGRASQKGAKQWGKFLDNLDSVSLIVAKDVSTGAPIRVASRRLTYFIDEVSFETKARALRVSESMEVAAGDWERACQVCGISFKPAPDRASATFVVRFEELPGRTIATAFLPNSKPADHAILIGNEFFAAGPLNPIGVMRHELGHVLGYKHEDLQDPEGCIKDKGDQDWIALSPPDRQSVMHYYCNAGGTRELAISDVDKVSHTLNYAPLSEGATLNDSLKMLFELPR